MLALTELLFKILKPRTANEVVATMRRRSHPLRPAGSENSITRHFAPPQGCLRSGRGCVAVMAQAAEQLVALELVPLQKAEGEEGGGSLIKGLSC